MKLCCACGKASRDKFITCSKSCSLIFYNSNKDKGDRKVNAIEYMACRLGCWDEVSFYI